MNSVCLLQSEKGRKREREGRKKKIKQQIFVFSSERVSNFSLEYRAIRPSAVFGTRRKAALRGEGFGWVPDLGSFLKTSRGRGFSLLGFYSLFKYFVDV